MEIGSRGGRARSTRAPREFSRWARRRRRLTALGDVCYGAHTLRRFGDLTSGPQALTGAHVASPGAPRESRRGRRAFLSAWLLALVAAAGCGPIGYMQQVHRRASDAVEEARRAGAESTAPYEYTSAVAYLAKAREEGAEAEYGNAIELGRRAEELALQARAIARRQGQAPATPAPRAAPAPHDSTAGPNMPAPGTAQGTAQ